MRLPDVHLVSCLAGLLGSMTGRWRASEAQRPEWERSSARRRRCPPKWAFLDDDEAVATHYAISVAKKAAAFRISSPAADRRSPAA